MIDVMIITSEINNFIENKSINESNIKYLLIRKRINAEKRNHKEAMKFLVEAIVKFCIFFRKPIEKIPSALKPKQKAPVSPIISYEKRIVSTEIITIHKKLIRVIIFTYG